MKVVLYVLGSSFWELHLLNELSRVVGHVTLLSASLHYFQELGAVSLDGYFHLWKAENNLCKVRQ